MRANKRKRLVKKSQTPNIPNNKRQWQFPLSKTNIVIGIITGILFIWLVFFPDSLKCTKTKKEKALLECVNFKLLQFQIGNPVSVMISIANGDKGIAYVTTHKIKYHIGEEAWDKPPNDLDDQMGQSINRHIPPGIIIDFQNDFSQPLLPTSYNFFHNGKSSLYVAGKVFYTDDEGKWTYTYVVKLWPPDGNKFKTVFNKTTQQ